MFKFFPESAAALAIERKVAQEQRPLLLAEVPVNKLSWLYQQETTGPRTTNLAVVAALRAALCSRGGRFASPADRSAVLAELRSFVPCKRSSFLEQLGISVETLTSPRFFGVVYKRRIRGERFAHYELDESKRLVRCAYEYGRGGVVGRPGIALSNPNRVGTNHLVVVPSMHRALLHYQGQRTPSNTTRYVSVAGDFTIERGHLLRRVIKQLPPGSIVELAFRYGGDGHCWHDTVGQILRWYQARRWELKVERIGDGVVHHDTYGAPPFRGLRLETRESQVLALEYAKDGCSGYDVLNYPSEVSPVRGVSWSNSLPGDRTLFVADRMQEALAHYELCPDPHTRYLCVRGFESAVVRQMVREVVEKLPPGATVADGTAVHSRVAGEVLMGIVRERGPSVRFNRRTPASNRPTWIEALRAHRAHG